MPAIETRTSCTGSLLALCGAHSFPGAQVRASPQPKNFRYTEVPGMGIKKKSLLTLIHYFLLLSGTLVLGYCGYVFLHARLFQLHANQLLDDALRNETSPSFASAHRTRDLLWNLTIDRRQSVIGRLEIPRLGISAIVLEGADDTTLRSALGHIPGTALPSEPGNIGIAGHRDTFFRNLREIQLNDQIRLTTAYGSYEYRVESLNVVEPSDTAVLDNGATHFLTLVTCYPFDFIGHAPKRFIVRARAIPRRSERG
jgi:sortase A